MVRLLVMVPVTLLVFLWACAPGSNVPGDSTNSNATNVDAEALRAADESVAASVQQLLKTVISPPKYVLAAFGGLVRAEGRWKQVDGLEDSLHAFQTVNTAMITCDRKRGVCREAVAELRPPLPATLVSQEWVYQIISWTPGEIIRAVVEFPATGGIELLISVPDESAERVYRETQARGVPVSNPASFRWTLE